MEKNSQWPGQANALKVEKILLEEKTKFQDLLVFESTDWGKVLVLDGVIQLTEKDEMSYQEMMAHLPLFSHPKPLDVLIIGGGDGGVLREVCKHDCVERISMYDLDAGVIEASKRFFPAISCAFNNPKLNLHIDDGVAAVKKAEDNTVDVIIIDSSDPIGPAACLFSKEFHADCARILKPGGVLCAQGECLWIHGDLIHTMIKENGAAFACAEYATIQVPTYPSGQIGAFLARKAGGPAGPSCRTPQREVPEDLDLRYYSSEMHEAAFALPEFIRKRIYGPSKKRKCETA
jgi:spermidine synthase